MSNQTPKGIRFSKEDLDALKIMAKAEHRTVSNMIKHIVYSELERIDKHNQWLLSLEPGTYNDAYLAGIKFGPLVSLGDE